MPKHTGNWVNDHTQICDRLNERVQLMEGYLDSKPDDFDGIAVKRFLLSQAREQISWYRQSIDALDFVGCVACRRSLPLFCVNKIVEFLNVRLCFGFRPYR